jgi:hypothetical protein
MNWPDITFPPINLYTAPKIDYARVHKYAAENRVNYNELCKMIHEAVSEKIDENTQSS